MNKKTNYFLLAGLFFAAFLLFEFTDIYSKSTWIKVFFLLIAATFLLSGFSKKQT